MVPSRLPRGALSAVLVVPVALAGLLPYLVPGAGPDLEPLASVVQDVAPPMFAFSTTDTGATGPELNLGVTSNGFIFVGGWNGVRRSMNDGATWQALGVSHLIAADRVLIVDHDTDRVFLDDTTLGCTILAWSDDYGASWLQNPAACGAGATDHQKVGVGKRTAFTDPTGGLLYENIVYVCANGLSHGNCGVSVDGGLSFVSATPHGIGCAFQGAPVADRNGVLYEPTTQCGAQVRSTADNGRTWVTRPIPFPASRDTPDVALTPDGTLYFFYTTNQWKPAFVRSSDGGAHWSGPFVVPVAGLTSAVFPSIVAGDDGRIALTFYGTTDGPAGWDLNPGNAPASVRWHGYVAVVTDANAAAPTVAPVQVTPAGDPLQIGCLSKLGACLNNIADYMDVDVGPDGRVYTVFTDGCLPGCAAAAQSTADHAIVVIQTDGPDLKA
jgi:hypothetical protein